MKRLALLSSLALVALAASGTAQAQGWGRGPGPGAGAGFGRGPHGGGFGAGMMAMLELTETQRADIAALRAEMMQQTADTRAALDEKRTEMHALWTSGDADREAILAKHAEMDELRQRLRVAKVDFRLGVLALLTPEQRERLQQMPAPGPGRHGRGGARGKGGGFGPGWGGGPCRGGGF